MLIWLCLRAYIQLPTPEYVIWLGVLRSSLSLSLSLALMRVHTDTHTLCCHISVFFCCCCYFFCFVRYDSPPATAYTRCRYRRLPAKAASLKNKTKMRSMNRSRRSTALQYCSTSIIAVTGLILRGPSQRHTGLSRHKTDV